MGFRVRRSNVNMQSMDVLENTIHFASDGWGDGSHLSKDELARLRQFHFKVEETEDLLVSDEDEELQDEPEGEQPEMESSSPEVVAESKVRQSARQGGRRSNKK